ncbi:MAG: hypothetical protein ACLFSQ_12455 [Candidatus Zixiibacteriota bacterium]
MSSIIQKLLEFGGIPLIMLIIGWVAGKFLRPWIHDKDHPSRLEWATELSMIADRVTDELVMANPGANWDDLLDRAVDIIIDKLEIPDAKGGKRRAARDEARYLLKTKLA